MATQPFTYSNLSLSDARNDLTTVIEKFKKHKFVEFNNSNPTDEERFSLMFDIGLLLGWKLDYDEPGVPQFTYEETHKFSCGLAKQENRNNQNDVVVAWHLEHPHTRFPQVGALWHMEHKSCAKEAGSTGFIDANVLFNLLSPDDQEFLEHCQIVKTSFFSITENNSIDLQKSVQFDGEDQFITVLGPDGKLVIPAYVKKPVVDHYLTGEKTLKISPKGQYTENEYVGHERLIWFDNRTPTKDEIRHYNRIAEFVYRNVSSNEEIKYFHYWDQGDAILVDVFSLIHCVRGGFNDGERLMKGIWAFPNTSHLSRDPSQQDAFKLFQVRI